MIPPLFLNSSQSKLLHRSSRIAQKWLHQMKSSSKTKITIHNVDWYTVYCDVKVGVCSSLCMCVRVWECEGVGGVAGVAGVSACLCMCVSPVSVSVSVSVNVFRLVPVIFNSAICLVHVRKHATLSCMFYSSLTSP